MTNRDLADLVLLGAIWGASFLLMRVAVPEFGPIPLIAARVGIGAAFLFAVLRAAATCTACTLTFGRWRFSER